MSRNFFLRISPLLIRPWFGVTVLTLAATGTGFYFGETLRFPDERDYFALAESLEAGRGFRSPEGELTAYRPPGYPFFLWLSIKTGYGVQAAKLLQALLLGTTALVCSGILKQSGGQFRGLPAWMILAYPVLLFTSATLYPQTPGAFLLVVILRLTFFNAGLLKAVCAGLLLGYLILCIPSFMLTAPVLALLLLGYKHRDLAFRFRQVVLLTLAALAVVSPWTFRNYQVFGSVVPVSTNSGLNLFLGNSPGTTPGSGISVDRSHLEEEVSELSELERDRRYRELALAWIRDHPGEAFTLYIGKALHYFHFTNRLATDSESGFARDLLMLLTWAPLLGLFLLRPLFRKRYPFSAFEVALWVLILSNAFLSAIFFTRIRFRLPFDVLMILANAQFLNQLFMSDSFRNKFTLRTVDHADP